MKVLDVIAWILVLVGALNWGSIGFFDFNFVDFLFRHTVAEKIVYDLVGISAIYLIIRKCCCCSSCCGTKKHKHK